MFGAAGWTKIAFDPQTHAWAKAAHDVGCRVVQDPKMRQTWLQCQGTWFVGVDALPTDHLGAIAGVALGDDIQTLLTARAYKPLHPAQLSVIYNGYPKPREGENAAGFRYRLNRDAAHVDGVLGVGKPKRRMVKEPHGVIIGIPLTNPVAGASPMVVWEGSHTILRSAFARAFSGTDPSSWSDIDVTDIYTSTRKQVFETCKRVIVEARVGEAYAIDPLCLHGVAPWTATDHHDPDGRMVAYFRPELSNIADWLDEGAG